MTTITILPETADNYRAIAGDKESTGRTAGEALDALTSQLADEASSTLVIVQNHNADQFFNAAQQERLTELMQLSKSGNLSQEEKNELESLVEAELNGARRRVEHELALKDEELVASLAEELEELLEKLTTIERQVISLLFEGYSMKEIATILGINPTTAKYNVSNIWAKISHRAKQMGNLAEDSKS